MWKHISVFFLSLYVTFLLYATLLYCAVPQFNRHVHVSMKVAVISTVKSPPDGLQEEARLAPTNEKHSGLSSAVIKRTKRLKKTNPVTHLKLFITVTESGGSAYAKRTDADQVGHRCLMSPLSTAL